MFSRSLGQLVAAAGSNTVGRQMPHVIGIVRSALTSKRTGIGRPICFTACRSASNSGPLETLIDRLLKLHRLAIPNETGASPNRTPANHATASQLIRGSALAGLARAVSSLTGRKGSTGVTFSAASSTGKTQASIASSALTSTAVVSIANGGKSAWSHGTETVTAG